MKYRLVSLYDELFTTGMKSKWTRIYIDLYAGAGYSRIRGTSRILKGSPALALTVPHPFDKYIFCEENAELLGALRRRTERIFPGADVSYVLGRCDQQVDTICEQIRAGSRDARALSLCFVDPFDFGIKFETIRRLSQFRVDFLVLLAIGMDANRNYERYVEGESTKIDEALGNSTWRERWEQLSAPRREFRSFLAQEFSNSMETLGYLPQPIHNMKHVRSDEKNLPLYYLALFSRHPQAYKFWTDVLKYGEDQRQLF